MMPAPLTDAYDGAELCDECDRESCEDHLPEVVEPGRRLRALTLDQLRVYQFPARPALLLRDGTAILRAGHLGEVFAERGIGKTWFLQSLALVAASGATALGFHAASPCRVLYIDGEMAADDLKARFGQLEQWLNICPGAAVTTIAADWQDEYLPRLDTPEGQALVDPFLETADLVLIDNRSCLFDPEGEKDPTKWQPAQDWLLSLRRRGKAVLMAHHANRQGGARGHSKPEDPLNLLIKLARPDDYSADQGSRFLVTFEKTRGIHGTAVSPFTARLTPDGWQTEAADPTSVAARLCRFVELKERAGEPVKTASEAVKGASVNRSRGLEAWAELLKTGAIYRDPQERFHVA